MKLLIKLITLALLFMLVGCGPSKVRQRMEKPDDYGVMCYGVSGDSSLSCVKVK